MPKNLMPANDLFASLLENLRSRVMGAQPYNPTKPGMGTLSHGDILSALIKGSSNPPVAQGLMEASSPESALKFSNANDQLPITPMRQALYNSELARSQAALPLEQQQGMKINPIDLLKNLDPDKLLE